MTTGSRGDDWAERFGTRPPARSPRRTLVRARLAVGDLAALARPGAGGLALALGLAWLSLRLGPGPADDAAVRDAVLTVLGTVIGFFAVATLVISVSLSLLQTAVDTWRSAILVELFVRDREREALFAMIYVSFLVSLFNLLALVADAVAPLAAVALPAVFAVATLALMVGFVRSRVELFDEANLRARLVRDAERALALADRTGPAGGPGPVERERLADATDRLRELGRVLVADRRWREANGVSGALAELMAARLRLVADGRIEDPGWPIDLGQVGELLWLVRRARAEDAGRLTYDDEAASGTARRYDAPDPAILGLSWAPEIALLRPELRPTWAAAILALAAAPLVAALDQDAPDPFALTPDAVTRLAETIGVLGAALEERDAFEELLAGELGLALLFRRLPAEWELDAFARIEAALIAAFAPSPRSPRLRVWRDDLRAARTRPLEAD